MNEEDFKNDLLELGINTTLEQLKLLKTYYKELIEYNNHTNLTAITDEKEVYYKHFYDSLTLVKVIDMNTVNNLLDIGSGAGFPGIVLKIFFPNIDITLIDSNNKKTTFLKYIVEKLNLKNVTIVHDRIENYLKNNLNKFDVITARAVTNLVILSELALPLVKKDKYFIAMKGDIEEELENSKYAIDYMHGEIESIITFELKEIGGIRKLIKVKKKEITSINEIRPYNKILKNPLQKISK